MRFYDRGVREAEQCARYAEWCAWWAELQERRPPLEQRAALDIWLKCIAEAYEHVQCLARETGLPGLNAGDRLDVE